MKPILKQLWRGLWHKPNAVWHECDARWTLRLWWRIRRLGLPVVIMTGTYDAPDERFPVVLFKSGSRYAWTTATGGTVFSPGFRWKLLGCLFGLLHFRFGWFGPMKIYK